MIDCRHVIGRMWEYLDGELPEDEAEEIRAHLDVCGRCNPQYQFQIRFLSAVVASRPGEGAPSPALAGRVKAALDSIGPDIHPAG